MTGPDPTSDRWLATGIEQHIPADLIAVRRAAFEERIAYAQASATHLWIITPVHVISADALASPQAPHLDSESLADIVTGCYVCEQSYTPRLRVRRCPGQPPA